jgi:hypothetical protein
VVPISVTGLFTLGHSNQALENAIGRLFHAVAESHASEVSHFVHDRVLDVGALATVPEIVEAVSTANRSYQNLDPSAIQGRIAAIEKQWAVHPASREILSSPASRYLRKRLELDRRWLRITVTDERGATVAASHKTLDYYQADEEYWQNIYANGRGAVSLTDVLYDDVTKSSYIGIGVPIVAEGTGVFIGTLDALIDVSSLFRFVHRSDSSSARTILVKADGTVINAPNLTLAMKVKSPEYLALRSVLVRDTGETGGHLVTDVPRAGNQLIAYANTGLARDYRNLDWIVLVTQPTDAALAPVQMVSRVLVFMSLMGLALAALIGSYFALHRSVPMAEIGELRHPDAPAEAKETTAQS